MNYKTTGYSFSHSPNALALNGLQPFSPISSPKISPLSFNAMPAQQVFDDNSEAIGSALAQGAYGLAKDVKSGFDADRAEKAELEKETRKHLRDLQLEKIKSDRTANYRQLQEDYLRTRIAKTDKEMNERLDSVGVPKSKRSIVVDPAFIQGTPPPGYEDAANKPFEQGDGENYEENTPQDPYMDFNKPVSDLPPIEPDLPVDEPLPDLAPAEGQETSMLQGIKAPPVFQFEDFSISYQPESLTAQAGGMPSPATVALSDTLKNLDLSSVPATVSFISPAQEQEMYNIGTDVADVINDADVQKKAQELLEIKAMKAAEAQPVQAQAQAQAQPAPTPDVSAPPPGGFFWNYEDAWKAHSVQLPGYKKPKIVPHTSPEGYPFWEVQPPEPIELTAEERMQGKEAKKRGLTGEQSKKLSDIREVRSALDVVASEMTQIENRGPIVGFFRGKNPYDVVAQRMEALINGLTPKVARGIFGEVGVLTDADIAHYKKILPNIAQTPELANWLFSDLSRKLDQTEMTYLDTLSGLGFDIGRFEEDAKALQKQEEESVGNLSKKVRELAAQVLSMQKGTPEYEQARKQLLELRMRQRAAEDQQPQ